ncbi:MAG: DUF421 domain-containing protein [Egibacteraceae bacterium]
MVWDWMGTTWQVAVLALLSTVGIFFAVLIATRLTGLRSFSKMSSFDFAMTVAVGSLMASVATSATVSLSRGIVVLAGLYGTQATVALLRMRTDVGGRLVDNTPMLLMAGTEMMQDHLHTVRVTESDVRAKLREANVLNYDQVVAVILETTGDISVLHGDEPFEADLLRGVIGAERVGQT